MSTPTAALARNLARNLALVAWLAPGAGHAGGHAETVLALREARASGEAETARSLAAGDARIWFDRVEGPGRPWSPVSGGPWADWDRFFRSESRVIHVDEDERSARTLVEEINDWYRLVERPPSRYFVTYYFDSAGRVEGLLVHPLTEEERGERRDLLSEFESWARRERPGLLERLMPDGELDPSPPKPTLWRESLLQWRESTGRPNPLAPAQRSQDVPQRP